MDSGRTNRDAPFAVGVDVIEIDRIESAIRRFGSRFLRKIYTPGEIEYCQGRPHPAQHFAARFAVKEAVYKAAGGVERLWFTKIEVDGGSGREPRVRLIGTKRLRGDQFLISISHTHRTAVAVALRIAQP
jgi:holo-[acyl-carrier protein] synthase